MERLLWVVLIAAIIWALAMAVEASAFDKSRASGVVGRLDSPIAMLELAESEQQFAAILDQGERGKNITVMQLNTYMDFVFILLYCLTFILLAAVCSGTSTLSMAVAAAILAAGVLDYWENFRLLGQFRSMRSGAAIAPLSRPVSLGKWGIFALALCLVGFALLQARSRIDGRALFAMSIFVFLAAGCTAVGLFRNRLIGASVLCLFPALLIAAWVWRPWRG